MLGVAGLVFLVVALVFGDWLDALLPDVELGDGLFSLPVLAGFVAAFGFAGAAVHSVTGTPAAAVTVGAAAGAGVAWATLRLTRALIRMPTDETFRTADLVGREGTVVTAIREGSLGEVRVAFAGQSLKLAARADRPLDRGEAVVVVEAISPTAVWVSSARDFWGSEDPHAAREPR